MSMLCRKATNSWKTSSGLSRSATVVTGADAARRPRCGEVEVAEVADEDDDRLARGGEGLRLLGAARPARRRSMCVARQATAGGTPRSSSACRSACPARTRSSSSARRQLGTGAAVVGAQPLHALAVPSVRRWRRPGRRGRMPPARAGRAAARQPSLKPEHADGVGGPTRERVPRSRRLTSPEARAWRRTVSMRCSTVTKLATASRPSTMPSSSVESKRSAKKAASEHGDEPVGALGDADVGGVAEPLGARLGVGHDAAEDEAGEGEPGHRAGCRPGRRSRGRGRRRSRRRRSGRASSRGRRPTCSTGPTRGP